MSKCGWCHRRWRKKRSAWRGVHAAHVKLAGRPPGSKGHPQHSAKAYLSNRSGPETLSIAREDVIASAVHHAHHASMGCCRPALGQGPYHGDAARDGASKRKTRPAASAALGRVPARAARASPCCGDHVLAGGDWRPRSRPWRGSVRCRHCFDRRHRHRWAAREGDRVILPLLGREADTAILGSRERRRFAPISVGLPQRRARGSPAGAHDH